jgi:hypothetical protein
MTQEPIKVFGEKAQKIKTGDLFIAVVGSVEGRTVVELVPITLQELCGGKGD